MQDTTIVLSDGKEVKMRTMLVRDVRAVSHIDNDIERELALISNLTGLSHDEIDAMPWGDYLLLQKALDNQMGKPVTGLESAER